MQSMSGWTLKKPVHKAMIAKVGAAAWPLAAGAQQGDRVRRIGVLMPGDENEPVWNNRLSALTKALADSGWTDGRNVRMDLRWFVDDIDRIPTLALSWRPLIVGKK
jgi:putative ABC transport system substrate-binding protein